MITVTKGGETGRLGLAKASAGWPRSMEARVELVGCRRLQRWVLESKRSLDKDLLFGVSLGIKRCPGS